MATTRRLSYALPKLDPKSITSTKLGESIKSTTGHDFDFRSPTGLLEYNPLRDPYLKKYFNRPRMLKRLVQRRCISSDLRVLCQTEEEYKLYQNFIFDEALKNSKRKEVEAMEAKEKSVKRKKHQSGHRRNGKCNTGKTKRTMQKYRRRFLRVQEKKLTSKFEELKGIQHKFRMERMKAMVLRYIQKELINLKRRNKFSLNELMKVVKFYDKCKDVNKKRELGGKLRLLQLQRMKEAERIRTLIELEILWKKHGDYACKAQEESRNLLSRPGMVKCTREAQGALLFSFLTRDIMQPRKQSYLSDHQLEPSKAEGGSRRSRVILPPIHQSQQQETRKAGGKDPDWREWIQRQQDQLSVQFHKELESCHDQRHKLFEILWKDVPSEAELQQRVQLRMRKSNPLPFGRTEDKRETLRPLYFGKNSNW